MKKISSIFALLLITLIWLQTPCLAAGKVVILALDRTSLAQVAGDPILGPWLARGAVGLINTATAALPTSKHVYATLGAGTRAMGTEYSRLVFNWDEEYAGFPVSDIYQRHQGREPEGEVIMLAPAAGRINHALRYTVVPGLLGGTLRSFGKVAAVLGNADGQSYSREAAVMLADQAGQIALGDVSRALLRKDPLYPYGLRLDPAELWAAFVAVFEQADVVLVDWGDTVRLDEYSPLLSAESAGKLRGKMFAEVAYFLERMTAIMGREDVLLLFSPTPPAGESGGGLLGWAALLGSNIAPGSFLISGTTRRPGVVALTDVAPTVLDQFGLPRPAAMVGRPLSPTGSGSAENLLVMQAQIDRLFRLRPALLRTYVFLQIVVVLGALL